MPLIDLHALSIELYERMGKDGCNSLSPLKDATPTNGKKAGQNSDDQAAATQLRVANVFDDMHLNAKGAAIVGPIVANALVKAIPELAAYIRTSAPNHLVP